MIKDQPFFLILIYVIFCVVYVSDVDTKYPFINLKANAHSFTPNDYASFIAFVDQFQTELSLVQTNLDDDNTTLIQEHVDKASKLFYRNLVSEFEEQDPNNAENITSALKSLQNSSFDFSVKEQQKINRIVADIDTKSNGIILWSLEQQEQEKGVESKFLDMIIGFMKSVIGGEKNEHAKEIQPLRFAELVDFVLIDYGNAFDVDFDMTDMSSNNDGIQVSIENMSATQMNTKNDLDKSYSLIDVAAYQSAQHLSAKILEIFNRDLKPITNDDSKVFITNLENSIVHFNNLIRDKASPTDLMMIVHTQIHPNLFKAFNVELL